MAVYANVDHDTPGMRTFTEVFRRLLTVYGPALKNGKAVNPDAGELALELYAADMFGRRFGLKFIIDPEDDPKNAEEGGE